VSELPERPDLDQLRRQARELLRAAAAGEPSALSRIRAVSGRVSLSAAQLALAREYGFPSWPALHAAVERRLAELPAAGESTGPRWSFGGAAAIETSAGTLHPGALVASQDRAAMDATLVITTQAKDSLAVPPRGTDDAHVARARATIALADSAIGTVSLTDDQGATYAVRAGGMSGGPGFGGEPDEPMELELVVEPAPARDCGWLELRGQHGSVTRLLPSPRPAVRVGPLEAVPEGPAARDVSEWALSLIGLKLLGVSEEALGSQCAAALAWAAEIQENQENQQASGSGTAGDVYGQLARLCAFFTGRGPADGLPRAWSAMIGAAGRADGAQRHLDISAVLPPADDTVVRVDSLASEPEAWKVYLSAEPGWWTYNADMSRKRALMTARAEDDLGGLYLSQFGGSSGHNGREDLALRFLPRLNPLARTLTLIFTHAAQQVTVELRLP
jgi:hypothetical protein